MTDDRFSPFPKKQLWLSIDTSGPKPDHEIIRLGILVVVNKENVHQEAILLAPGKEKYVDPEWIKKTHGREVEEVVLYPRAFDQFHNFLGILNRFIDRYNSLDKFIPCGFQINRTLTYLENLFTGFNNKFLYSYLFKYGLDVGSVFAEHTTWTGIPRDLKPRDLETLSGLARAVDCRQADPVFVEEYMAYQVYKKIRGWHVPGQSV